MNHPTHTDKKWREVITNKSNLWTLNYKEIWDYRDLLIIWMRRDILSIYKQTILGPIWFVLQPVLTTITFVFIFSRIGKFSTTGLPPVIFYLSGIVIWSYFAECITKTATFFKDSTPIFSKVYFPRLIIPLSLVLTNLVKFGIQFLLFIAVYVYYLVTGHDMHPNIYLPLIPVLIILIAGLGLGSGIIISSLTTKYKDFVHLITFGVQLIMFISPVLFPVEGIADSGYKKVILANPVTGIIEAFRFGFTGKGYFSWQLLTYDASCMMILLLVGILVFNSVEKDFVDTI
ncbi:ABC transporter permease [Ferruginibacter paludis]|uniref:ABC transporter permease n=1 Tax=Ferruginibacter paludis TaxID=1310417 RepID=UPI0025B4E1AA|nr:ABC transporter permease [Ferruginibacter paludis]MDN3656770.1 ABC transporter permease [Ferruginibacter paludis]